jgi:hypothetical protein
VRSDGGAWAVASANRRARADVKVALEGDVGGAGVSRRGQARGKREEIERERLPVSLLVIFPFVG